jgi:hypothetical protein
MDQFVEEVQEEVRKEQWLRLWNQYGNMIIGVVVGAFIATGGYLFWSSQHDKRVQEQSILFEQALGLLEEKKDDAALKLFEKIATQADQGYKALALFHLGQNMARQGQSAEGTYKKIIDDHKNPLHLRELATYHLMAGRLQLENPEVFLKDLETILKPQSPWYASLLELKAQAYLKLNQKQNARNMFKEITLMKDAPQGLRARAHAMLEMIE